MTFPTRFARALAPLAIVAAAATPAAAAESPDLAKFRGHLASVQSMTANFVQTDGRGRSAAGTLQLKRPGRIRFQYGSGDLLLVANGKRADLHRLSGRAEIEPGRSARRRSACCCRANPNIKGRAQVMPSKDPNVVVVRARDPAQYGTLILAFLRSPSAPGGLMLYGWTAIDAQNKGPRSS